ncbi:MAG: TIGR00296 family protein [Spirochaetota bacterium]
MNNNYIMNMNKEEYKEYQKKLVAEAIINYLKNNTTIALPDDVPDELLIKRGVFVTLRTKKGQRLRGCIGRPLPESPLASALINSAISAAVSDPRFPSVKYKELKDLSFEISVLSKPELIKVDSPEEYKSKIEIGKHGLIVENDYTRGLLLPQVAPQYDWTPEEFLKHTCRKAGLSPDDWKKENTKVYSFYLYELIEGDFTPYL